MVALVYSDASYCDKADIGACGFIVLINGRVVKHQVQLVSGLKKPTNAEIYALVAGLQCAFLLNGVKSIIGRTDYESIITRKKKTGQFAELEDTLEIIRGYGIGVTLNYVRGHGVDKYNNRIDKSCIEELRKYLKDAKRI